MAGTGSEQPTAINRGGDQGASSSGGTPMAGSGGSAGSAGSGGSAGSAGSASPWQPAPGQLPIEQLKSAKVEVIAVVPGSGHNEGPAFSNGRVFWCDAGGLFRLTDESKPSLYVANDTCGAAYAAADGSLLLAFGQNGVARVGAKRIVEQLAALPMGGFANDITLDAVGNIYVSNTPRGEVLRVTPLGLASVVAQNLPGANGLEVDPRSESLYVNQTSQGRVVRLSLGRDGSLGAPETFASNLEAPDGAAFDAWGNYWVTEFSSDRIRVFSPSGEQLVSFSSGGASTTNLAFGGSEHDVLYVTGGGTLRRVAVRVPGFRGHPGVARYPSIGTLPFTVTDSAQ